jgi:hypothetical protein
LLRFTHPSQQGFFMSSSALLYRIPFTVVISLGTAFASGPRAIAEEIPGFAGGELAVLADMRPLVAIDAEGTTARSGGRKATVRQSGLAHDRSERHRHGEIFQMSRMAMPLLVVDLEPRVVPAARPMSGRSVGAQSAVGSAYAAGKQMKPAVSGSAQKGPWNLSARE